MIRINEHEIVLDSQERLEPWTTYDRVIRLAMDFITHCPTDPNTGLPWYLAYSCFWIDPLRPAIWPDNPAGKFAWAVTTLMKYYPYSGDDRLVKIVAEMLDRLWDYRTPEDFIWGGVPYASAHPGSGCYFGARADGEYVTEPDKIAQVGKAFIDFYQLTGEDKYLKMGKHCAEVLDGKLREGDEMHSPLPFRVAVEDGNIVEQYTSHMIPLVKLFDSLIALGEQKFASSRDAIWKWIEEYPLSNHLWKGHFEDIRLDPENKNRDQLSPLETARYIMDNTSSFPGWKNQVEGILEWVSNTLGSPTLYTAMPIHEQLYCYFPMGSHTARYASICARYAELTGDECYHEKARRCLSWASYMANEDGTVTVGIDRPDYYNQCWFTDGYFDYVPHFIDCMAALPELASSDTDHMLRSTSIIKDIEYLPLQIAYISAEQVGVQRLRLTFEPRQVYAGGTLLDRHSKQEDKPGWHWDKDLRILDIIPGSTEVKILGRIVE